MKIKQALEKLLDSENLSFDEAEASMLEVMSGQVSPVLLSSWLTALRMKGETPSEIAGCAAAMRSQCRKIKCPAEDAVDIVGTGGDGAHTINISTAAAFVAAGAGLCVAKHGNRAVSSSSGAADVLSALGVKIELRPEQMEECLEKTNMAFLYAPLLHPAMKHAMPVRKELGIRTVFNILGPLCNPAFVKRYVLGVYDRKLCRVMAEAALELGYGNMMVVHGLDGLDEITLTGPSLICELRDGKIREYEFSPSDAGMQTAPPGDLKGATPEENAEILLKTLKGEIKGPKSDIVILSAAAALIVTDRASGWKDAVSKAKAAISSGSAAAKLRELAELTKSY